MSLPAVGRRERKKAQTRAAIADTALRLFLERGFEQVTVADVAEAADVSQTTVFNHFPSKEALVLDEDTEREAALVDAVRHRPPGTSIVDALHRYVADMVAERSATDRGERLRRFQELLRSAPTLREYAHRMWARHEDALAHAVADELGVAVSDPMVLALAHLVIESPAVGDVPGVDPVAGIDAVFALLRGGWDTTREQPRPLPTRAVTDRAVKDDRP